MTSERRYDEREIVALLEHATREESDLPSAEGLTLDEVRGIGIEAGISADRIDGAASALDRARRDAVMPTSSFLGLPTAFSRAVPLPRLPSDDEWARLVADLHEVFAAPGEVVVQGSLRRWQNDELIASVEPVDDGARLRLITRSPHPWLLLGGGLFALAFAIFLAVVLAAKGKLGADLAATIVAATPALLGLLGIAAAAHQFPRWQRAWGRRLDLIAAQAKRRIS